MGDQTQAHQYCQSAKTAPGGGGQTTHASSSQFAALCRLRQRIMPGDEKALTTVDLVYVHDNYYSRHMNTVAAPTLKMVLSGTEVFAGRPSATAIIYVLKKLQVHLGVDHAARYYLVSFALQRKACNGAAK